MAVRRKVSKVRLLTNPFIAGQAGIRKHPDVEAKKFREFLMYVIKDDNEKPIKDREILYLNMQNLLIILNKKLPSRTLTALVIVAEAYKYEYFTVNYMQKQIKVSKASVENHIRKMVDAGTIDVFFDKNKDVEIEYKQIFEDGWKDQRRKYCLSGDIRKLIDSYVLA